MKVAAIEINYLLDDSLLLQSIQEGSLVMIKQPVRVDDIIEHLKTFYLQVLKGRSAVVKMRLEKGLPEYIMCDLRYIKRY